MSRPIDEVVTALDLALDAAEASILDVKATARASVDDERFGDLESQTARLSELRRFADDIAGLRDAWFALAPVTVDDGAEAENPLSAADDSSPSRRFLGRVRAGERTPEPAFRRPILEVLVELGGSGTLQEVLDLVGTRLEGVLQPVDFLGLPSDPEAVRWRNTAQWSRNELVQLGLMEPVRSRGVWQISDAGRAWLDGGSAS